MRQDPREYLPFLRELRALEKYYQRFKIDDHLRRYDKALLNLSLAGKSYRYSLVTIYLPFTGSERFDEAMAYVERHQLYDAALAIWRETDHYEVSTSTSCMS